MGEIAIHGLHVEARVGVTEEERSRPQPLRIDIVMEADLSVAGSSDDLGDTVDYAAVAARVATCVREREARLLEHVADKIARLVAAFPKVRGVRVEVTKEQPPMGEKTQGVSVRISRRA